ncbi:MAG: ABC transporter permease [Thermodesulfobacteriota bacterium]
MAIPISYGWRNLWTRKFTTVLTAGGMALVTFVFAAVMMLAAGLEQTLVDTGSPDNALILRPSAETEVMSVVTRHAASIIEVQPEIALNARGEALAAKECVVLVTLPKLSIGKPANVIVRGAGSHSQEIRPQVRVTSGRAFRPGSREIMVGSSIAKRIEGAVIGARVQFAMVDWDVVGVFEAGGTAFDSEVWADVEQVMSAFRRKDYSMVIAKVPGNDALKSFGRRFEGDPRVNVKVQREIEYYRDQSAIMTKFIRILGTAMTLFFSIGSMLGAMVTMYTAVANRTGEIGTLRALGFRRRDILVAFLMESVLLGLLGGTAGLAASSFLQFLTISTMNWATFSELAFGFYLTPWIATGALSFSMAMGLVGGLLPAWRGARLKIVDALRAS